MKIDNKVPIAVESHTKLDLPFDHVSTGMFMLLQPMYYRHTLKTENNKFHFVSNVRPNPMVIPTFGRARQNLRHFFVPYRLIFPNWEESINDVIASNYDHSSQVIGVPQFTATDLMDLFTYSNNNLTTIVTTPSTSPKNYDFVLGGVYYKFTRLGRHFYKVLYSLGYELVGVSKQFKYNALALLAYARVYCDWYANSQYLNDALYLSLQRLFKYNDPTTPLILNRSDLYNILLFVRPAVYNTNNYFEDAWDNPVSPNSNQFTGFTFSDPTSSNGTYITTNGIGTPEMLQNSNTSVSVGTQYLHNALQRLSQYQRRHALSGARAIDRVLAEYGIQTDYLRIQRSIYVGCTSNDIDINSIYATANGAAQGFDSVVGDYAGAGFGAGEDTIQFQNDEEGIFITISTIQPSGGYYQGYDRQNRHLTKEQFYNAAFDTLGVQSIEKGEVYVSKDFSTFSTVADDYAGHFGFTARYGEYKRSINRVSGDIALESVLAGGHAWHMMREFNDQYFNNSVFNITHDEDFCRGTDAEQYMRLFTYNNYENDPFNLFLHVDCISYAPCHGMSDSFDWDTNAPQVAISSNGSKVN
jgi:hypothetical protein